MFTYSKNQKHGSETPILKRVLKRPLKYIGCQKRCLATAAVILFCLTFLNTTQSPFKSAVETFAEERAPIEETMGDYFGESILGGPLNLGASILPSAQAAFDYTSDDEQENSDFSVFEGSSLISQDAPVPPGLDPFGAMNREIRTYVVQNGDNPFNIAAKFGINSYTVLAANNLRDGDLIRPGDKLTILPINGVRVKVVAKDTLASLAKKYNGKAEEISAFNELQSGNLIAGNYVIIPDGEMPAAQTTPRAKVSAPKYAKETTPVSNWLIAPATGKNWGRIHSNNGVDISNVCGTPVYAAAAGKVILSDGVGWNGGYGKYIKIQHPNGVVTLYSHSSQLLVNVGDEVAQGQQIMVMGTTGRSTGCHVHFEVRGAANPMARR